MKVGADSEGETESHFHEDTFLAIIALLSSGIDKSAIRKRLGLSDDVFRRRLRTAYLKLKRLGDLTEEAASAVIRPRSHGSPPNEKYLPRYSAQTVTVELARTLDAFHDSCLAAAEACRDMDLLGLSEIADWNRGWRPADYYLGGETKVALESADPDISLFVRPEGIRLAGMKGQVDSVHLRMIRKKPVGGVIYGYLLRDVADPESSLVFNRGAIVATCLSVTDAVKWERYLDNHGTGRKAARVCIRKTIGNDGVTFSPSGI